MLESILQSINQNLERIANAQEEANVLLKKQMQHVAIGVDVGAAELSKTITETIIPNIEEPINKAEEIPVKVEVQPQVAPVIPAQPAPMPVAPATSVQPVPAPATPVIPTTTVQESFTREQLAVAMSNAVSAGKMNIVQGILQQFGVQALTQINPADYNKVATMLKEAGVNI